MSRLWQRFTEGAKRVVIAAQQEAAHTGEPYVSPEHLLLGVVKENDTVATRVLNLLSVSPVRVRAEIERQIGTRAYRRLNNNDVTLDPRMKRVLDFAYAEAREASTNYLGVEHLLLGIIREGDGIAYRTLARLGVDITSARRAVRDCNEGEQAAGDAAQRTAAGPTREARQETQPAADPGGSASQLTELAGEVLRLLSQLMIERSERPTGAEFTPRTQRLLAAADARAAREGAREVTPLHLLRALANSDEAVAAAVLARLGSPFSRVREALEASDGAGESQKSPADPAGAAVSEASAAGQGEPAAGHQEPDVEPSPAMLAVAACAFAEAYQLGMNYVGEEHLLLGLLLVQEGGAQAVLAGLGLTAHTVRQELRCYLGLDRPPQPPEAGKDP